MVASLKLERILFSNIDASLNLLKSGVLSLGICIRVEIGLSTYVIWIAVFTYMFTPFINVLLKVPRSKFVFCFIFIVYMALFKVYVSNRAF